MALASTVDPDFVAALAPRLAQAGGRAGRRAGVRRSCARGRRHHDDDGRGQRRGARGCAPVFAAAAGKVFRVGATPRRRRQVQDRQQSPRRGQPRGRCRGAGAWRQGRASTRPQVVDGRQRELRRQAGSSPTACRARSPAITRPGRRSAHPVQGRRHRRSRSPRATACRRRSPPPRRPRSRRRSPPVTARRTSAQPCTVSSCRRRRTPALGRSRGIAVDPECVASRHPAPRAGRGLRNPPRGHRLWKSTPSDQVQSAYHFSGKSAMPRTARYFARWPSSRPAARLVATGRSRRRPRQDAAGPGMARRHLRRRLLLVHGNAVRRAARGGDTTSGYTGGTRKNPTYEEVSSGRHRARGSRAGGLRPEEGELRQAARGLLAQRRSDGEGPPVLRRRHPVPDGDLRAHRRSRGRPPRSRRRCSR